MRCSCNTSCEHLGNVHGLLLPQLPCCSDAAIDASLPSIAIDTAVREHAAEGRPVYRIHAERLAALAPNVIITQSQCEVCAGAVA